MGLDITAYEKVLRVGDWPEGVTGIGDFAEYVSGGQHFDAGGYYWNGQRITYVLASDIKYYPLHAAPLTPGLYAYADRFTLDCGSYGSYNAWRDWLSQTLLDMPAHQVWTLWRTAPAIRARGAAWLVNFSDAEGIISGPVAARILGDLRQYEDRLRSSAREVSPSGWYDQLLSGWLKALALASDDGLIDFH